MKKRTHPNIIRFDSEDERNTSGVTDIGDDHQSDTVDNVRSCSETTVDAATNHEFKKPLLPSELKPTKRKHKKNHSNGNTVISRDDALILVPDGVQSSDGFTFIRTPRGSDNENSDTEVSAFYAVNAISFTVQSSNSQLCCNFLIDWSPRRLSFGQLPWLHQSWRRINHWRWGHITVWGWRVEKLESFDTNQSLSWIHIVAPKYHLVYWIFHSVFHLNAVSSDHLLRWGKFLLNVCDIRNRIKWEIFGDFLFRIELKLGKKRTFYFLGKKNVWKMQRNWFECETLNL